MISYIHIDAISVCVAHLLLESHAFPSIPCCSGMTLDGLLKEHPLVEDHLSTALLFITALIILHVWQHRNNPATGTDSREAMMLE